MCPGPLAIALAGFALAFGCKSSENDVLRPLPGPRLAADSRLAPKHQRFVVGPEAELKVELKAKGARATLVVGKLSGFLEISPLSLEELRGELRADLASLRVLDGPLLASQALTWLGADEDTDRRSRARYARFVIRKVVRSSAPSIYLAPTRRRQDGAFLEATLAVLGDLELHGYRKEQEVELLLRVPLRDQVPDFRSIDVRTARPARIDLLAHRVEAELTNTAGTATTSVRSAALSSILPLRAVE